MDIRKYVNFVEEIHQENGRTVSPHLRKAAAVAIIKNPFAGQFAEDLSPLTEIGAELGLVLTRNALKSLEATPDKVESFGKGAIVGLKGELEHAAAILHPKLGISVREVLEGGKAIMPSSKKVACAGTEIDVPIHFKNAAFVRSHFDAMAVRVPDAPREDEIMIVIVLTTGGRPLPRVGGLKKEEATKGDGLR